MRSQGSQQLQEKWDPLPSFQKNPSEGKCGDLGCRSPWNALWDRSPGAVWTWGKLRIPIPVWNWKSQKGTWPEKPRKKKPKQIPERFIPGATNIHQPQILQIQPSGNKRFPQIPSQQIFPGVSPPIFPKPEPQRGLQLDPQSRNFWEQQDGPGSDPKDPAWFPTRSWRIFLLSQLIFVPWTALAQLRMCSWALPWEEILPGEGLGGEDPKSRSGAAKKKKPGRAWRP